MTWIPGDWMSRSTTPTCRPSAARMVATFAVVFDLPVPPRNECTETTWAMPRPYPARSVGVEAHAACLLLEVAEVVGVGDLGDLLGSAGLVDLDAELLDLGLQAPLAREDLARHPLEDPRELAERVFAGGDRVEARSVEGLSLDRRRGVDDLADLLQILELQVVQPFLRQRRVQPGPEHCGVEGLGQVVGGADLDAADDAVELVHGRDHDHRQVTEAIVGLDPRQLLVAVQL